MRDNKGITLIELIIVIAIIGVLVVAFGFSFQGWVDSYETEREIKEMHVDLMNARARAMQRNRTHFVGLTATQYTIQEDINPWPDGDGLLTANDNIRPSGYNEPIPLIQKDLNTQYPITWSDLSDVQIVFTKRGLSNDTKTICSNTDIDADYNCIEISASRINLGKLTTKIPDGGACGAANCVSK